jgi:hypothetical protein
MRKFAKENTKGDNIVQEPIGNILETRWKQFLKSNTTPPSPKEK